MPWMFGAAVSNEDTFPSRRGVEHLDRGLVLVLRDERELRPIRAEHHARRPQQILGLGLRLPHALAGLEVGRRDRVGRPARHCRRPVPCRAGPGRTCRRPPKPLISTATRKRPSGLMTDADNIPPKRVLRPVELQVAQLFPAGGIGRDDVALLACRLRRRTSPSRRPCRSPSRSSARPVPWPRTPGPRSAVDASYAAGISNGSPEARRARFPLEPAAAVPTAMRRTTSSVLASFTTIAKLPLASPLTVADSRPSAL